MGCDAVDILGTLGTRGLLGGEGYEESHPLPSVRASEMSHEGPGIKFFTA